MAPDERCSLQCAPELSEVLADLVVRPISFFLLVNNNEFERGTEEALAKRLQLCWTGALGDEFGDAQNVGLMKFRTINDSAAAWSPRLWLGRALI